MAAAAAVPGNRGSRGVGLALRKEGGEGEDGSELAEMVQASQGEGEGVTRSAGAIRRRRGASTAVLGVRARDGAAWRCREASGKHQRRGEGWGAARGRRRGDGVRRRTASLQEQRREMERGQNRK